MKTHPILFSGPMVQAILDGRKTVTRRIIKLPGGIAPSDVTLTRIQDGFPDGPRPVFGIGDEPNAFSVRCPYGGPGDQLWVKETFGPCAGGIVYRADGGSGCPDGGKWKPSIFMPRWASRITLENLSVRFERVQDITEDEARAEGVDYSHPNLSCFKSGARAVYAFQDLWTSIHGPGSWERNDWVSRNEFRKVEP